MEMNHIYAEAGDPEHKLCRVRWKKTSLFVERLLSWSYMEKLLSNKEITI